MDKYVLCACVSMGCARQQAWDESCSTYVPGAWVARTTFYNHKRLDDRLTAFNDSLSNDQQSADSITLSTFSYDSRIHASREQSVDSLQSMTARAAAEVEFIPTDDASAALKEDIDNLAHLAKCVNQRILSFSTQAPLMFVKPPDIHSKPYSNPSSYLTDPNTGLYQLDIQASVNVDLLAHEQNIFQALLAVRALVPGAESLDKPRQKILDRVTGELERVNLIRGREWDRQLMLRKKGSKIYQQPCRQRKDGSFFIDAGA